MAMPNGMSYKEFKIGARGGQMVRLSYAASLFKARKINVTDKDEKFSPTLIFKKTDKEIVDLCKQAIIDCAVAKWGDVAKERLKSGLIKNPILDGGKSVNKKTGKLNEGMSDEVFYIRPSSGAEMPPKVIYRSPNIQATLEEVYSGCFGAAVINAYWWEHPTQGDGVSFGIKMFQKLADGPRIGGGPVDAAKYYEEVVDEDAQGSAPEETHEGAGSAALFA
jgi:hypothetical protein